MGAIKRAIRGLAAVVLASAAGGCADWYAPKEAVHDVIISQAQFDWAFNREMARRIAGACPQFGYSAAAEAAYGEQTLRAAGTPTLAVYHQFIAPARIAAAERDFWHRNGLRSASRSGYCRAGGSEIASGSAIGRLLDQR